MMGLFRRTKRHSMPSVSQADNLNRDKRTLEQQLIDASGKLAYLQALPLSSWRPTIVSGQISNYSVDKRTHDISVAKAEVAELKTKLRLAQRLTLTVPPITLCKNAPTEAQKGTL